MTTWIWTDKGAIAFPMTPTTIDGMTIGATTPAPGSFTDLNASVSAVLATLAVSGLQSASYEGGIAASATHTIAGGTALTKTLNIISTVAGVGDAVTLAALGSGEYQDVFNAGANAIAVFPAASGVAIDGGSAGASVTLSAGNRCRFWGAGANTVISAQHGAVSA